MGEASLRGKASIVGIADAMSPSGELAGSNRLLELRMIRDALADAGLTIADVDGLAVATGGTGMSPAIDLAQELGIHPRWIDTTMSGGSSFEIHVEHAAAAVAAGLCEVAVSVYAATPRSSRKKGGPGFQSRSAGLPGWSPMAEWERWTGLRTPIGAYALAASRHMAQFGTTSEQLAQIAVSTRQWAERNPRARHQTPLTVEEVLASPMQSSPLHTLDCCLVTDGAGAVVVTTPERARSLRQRPVHVLGAGTCTTHSMISQMPDLTVTAGAVSGPQAFAMAGIKPSEVDAAQLYDSFTITVLLALEDLGFCAKGEGGAFVEDGRLGPGGALPTNTNGGGLSCTHPGMYGMFLLCEAVRRVRDGDDVDVAHGCGGVLSATGTLVLGSEATL